MSFPGFYDFSSESGIKESLFEDMQRAHSAAKLQASSPREKMSFDELSASILQAGKAPPPKAGVSEKHVNKDGRRLR